MGQTIEVAATQLGNVAIFDTDRGFTGQDGSGYLSVEAAHADSRFPGKLATRLFEADDSVTSVWVASSQVVVKRSETWDDDAADAAAAVIRDFYRFYDD